MRTQVAAIQQALQDRQPDAVMEHVATDFSGVDGMDRQALSQLLRLQFLANQRIGATLGPLDVTMRGDHATVRFSALLTGGSTRWMPDQAGSYQVTTGWKMEDGDWKLYVAQWKR